MPCSVYCLVPSPDDIDPLLSRLQEAGIPSRDIAVVRRDEAMAAHGGELAAAPPQWWYAPLTPTALWWVALYAWQGAVRVAADDSGGYEVISLARYKAERRIAR